MYCGVALGSLSYGFVSLFIVITYQITNYGKVVIQMFQKWRKEENRLNHTTKTTSILRSIQYTVHTYFYYYFQ